MTPISRIFIGLSVFALVVSACSNDDDTTQELEGDEFRTWVGQETENSMTAVIGGKLVTAGDCLAVDNAGEVNVVLWPHGTELLDDDRIGVHVPGAGDIELGTTFSAAGGYAAYDEDMPFSVPSECLADTSGEIAAIQQAGSVDIE